MFGLPTLGLPADIAGLLIAIAALIILEKKLKIIITIALIYLLYLLFGGSVVAGIEKLITETAATFS